MWYEDIAYRLVGLPCCAVVGREATVVFVVGAVGGVAAIVPRHHDVTYAIRRKGGLPLRLRGDVSIQLHRGEPCRAIVSRANIVNITQVRTRTMCGIGIVNDILST